MSGFPHTATLATALGCGLIAGVFFAFSAFVMPALKALSPAEGIAAMQSINEKAVTPLFMTALFGTALACLGLSVWAAISSGDRTRALILAAAGLYLIGTIGVTIAGNVPLNDTLADVDAQASSSVETWNDYLDKWTLWNHLRTIAALAAAGLLTAALDS